MQSAIPRASSTAQQLAAARVPRGYEGQRDGLRDAYAGLVPLYVQTAEAGRTGDKAATQRLRKIIRSAEDDVALRARSVGAIGCAPQG